MRFRGLLSPIKRARVTGVAPAHSSAVADLPRGGRGRVVATVGCAAECDYLRGLGIEPGVEVEVCRAGSPCVVNVGFACGGVCRIGIGREIARRIYVDCTCNKTGGDGSGL
ncbi:MAG: ferrous iron transport protein A [Phycisphaeraceae bacterium]|nr:ferrous iron transport protein A [Phycisphaeraceae bacterium]MCW5762589.1 ferrous iron transport protein A [Phycisphaeraceae bacterium]